MSLLDVKNPLFWVGTIIVFAIALLLIKALANPISSLIGIISKLAALRDCISNLASLDLGRAWDSCIMQLFR